MTLSIQNPVLLEIETPALIVDLPALERNIHGMAGVACRAGVALRPHAKTHKSPEIAALQIQAGALGIGCATIWEAEALSAAGIPGLLLTSPVMDRSKSSRVAALNRRHDLTVVVDHIEQVDGLIEALRPGDPPLRIVVDVDVGHGRTGVTDIAAGIGLVKYVASKPSLRFAGFQGFAGHVQHIQDAAKREDAAAKAAALLRTYSDASQRAGFPAELITGSGTGACRYDFGGPYNEVQPGSYVFMDSDYAQLKDENGTGLPFAPSLFVLATVVSINQLRQVTVDAGTKAIATNGPRPCHLLGVPAGAVYTFAGDEHGIISIPDGQPCPTLGSRVLIGATHCDPTVNLHSTLHPVIGDNVQKWSIIGRYPV